MIGRRPLTPVTAAACMALALVVSACSRDGATTGPTQGSGKDYAANLRLVSGDQQLGAVALPLSLPIVVKVVDAGGQPVQGAAVAFSVRAGGGSINPAANVSDASGLVTSTWTLGTTLGANKAVAILTNNFVLDSTTKRLHLIDLDEGGIYDAPRRNLSTDRHGGKWFSALQYPNLLRHDNRELYTKVQFAAAVLALAPESAWDCEHVDLVKQAKVLGEYFLAKDTSNAKPRHESFREEGICDMIKKMDEMVNKFLGVDV